MVVLSIAGSACAGSGPGPGAGRASPSATAEPEGPPAPGGGLASSEAATVLDFKAPRVGGGQVNGGDYLGKDLAAWVWAPW